VKIGLITIGQSPRVDVVPEMVQILGNVDIIECGALDNLTAEEIQKLAPKEGDYVLVTRLRNGTQVRLSREKIVKLLQTCIEKLENEVDVIGILCTGKFSKLKSKKLLIEPSILLLKVVESILPQGKLGILIPSPDQIEETEEKWSHIGVETKILVVSPYLGKEEEFKKAARTLKDCDLIVLDCIGYNLKAKEIMKNLTKKPVLLPRTLMAHVIRELVEGG